MGKLPGAAPRDASLIRQGGGEESVVEHPQLLVGWDGTWQVDQPGLADDTNIGRLLQRFRGFYEHVAGVGTGRLVDRLVGGAAGWRAQDRLKKSLLMMQRDYLIPMDLSWVGLCGYSRGGAMAIEAAHEMLKYGRQVDWLGLFEPVHSIGRPWRRGNGRWKKWIPPNVLRWSVIYAANDERPSFRPTWIPKDPRGTIDMLPGSHGDIGGTGDLLIGQLALHIMCDRLIEAGGNVPPYPHPPQPSHVTPTKPWRILPAYHRKVEMAGLVGARVHPWCELVPASPVHG